MQNGVAVLNETRKNMSTPGCEEELTLEYCVLTKHYQGSHVRITSADR